MYLCVASFVSRAFIVAVNDQLARQMMKKLEELSSCVKVRILQIFPVLWDLKFHRRRHKSTPFYFIVSYVKQALTSQRYSPVFTALLFHGARWLKR
jgi:hypothetical protein